MPLPRRRCWADEVDADVASSDSSTPRPPLAAAPPRRLPFRVILSAYIRGLLQGQGSRASLAVLQGLLRGHPCGQHLRSPLADLVFYISFDDNEIAEHQRDYLAALRAGSFSRAALRFWSSLLDLECRRCLLTCFGVDVHVDEVAAALARLLQRCPALLGGPPVELQWALPTSTIPLPSVESCVDCAEPLSLSPLREAQAYFLNYGWVSVRYRTGTCPCAARSTLRAGGCGRDLGPAVQPQCRPEDCQFFQIVANPRRNSKAFIEMRVLWLLRASLFCATKGPSVASSRCLRTCTQPPPTAAMTACVSNITGSCGKFFCLLWENSADFVQSDSGPWTASTMPPTFAAASPRFSQCYSNAFRRHIFCSTAAACARLALSRSMPSMASLVTFATTATAGAFTSRTLRPQYFLVARSHRSKGCLYCRTHNAAPPSRVGPAPRVLRHRDVGGVRTYKIEGASSWRAAADVPAASVREYEIHLAAAAERRKRRRGQVPPPPPPVIAEGADADEAEARRPPNSLASTTKLCRTCWRTSLRALKPRKRIRLPARAQTPAPARLLLESGVFVVFPFRTSSTTPRRRSSSA